jgi:hypothetical protein
METSPSRIGWGAAIEGHQFDLEDWQDALKPPFDPWVVDTGRGPVVRSKALDLASSETEANDLSEALIETLNGALAASRRTRPVRLGGVVEFMSDGIERRSAFAAIKEGIEARSRAAAVGTAIGPDGKPSPSPSPEPSEAQRWFGIAASDDVVADALTYFSRGDDWFDIYKALECLIIRFGVGSEGDFFKLDWVPSRVRLLKQTANYARHARRKFDPPEDPMPRDEARDLLGVLISPDSPDRIAAGWSPERFCQSA